MTAGRWARDRARRRRLGLALLAAVAALAVGGLGAAAPVSAHATLVSTSPVDGSQVDGTLTQVSLTFDEAVSVSAGAIRVLDPTGSDVEIGTTAVLPGDPATVFVRLRPDLPKAPYLVVWHAVSDDSHPVYGQFRFGYGVPPARAAGPVTPGTDRAAPVLRRVLDLLELAGVVVLVGGAFFVRRLWPQAIQLRRARRILVGSWLFSVASDVALFLLLGAYAAGLPLQHALDSSLLGQTLGTWYGRLLLLRLVALAAAVPLYRTTRREQRPVSAVDLTGVAFLLLMTFGLTGHSGQGSRLLLSAAMDAIHLAAAAVWLGGLVMLATVVLDARHASPAEHLAPLLARWSRTATLAVLALIGTGSYQAWRQTGSWDSLPGTGYGLLLLGKVGLLGVMLVLAALGRSWVRRYATGWPDGHPGPVGARRSLPGSPGAGAAGGTSPGLLTVTRGDPLPTRPAVSTLRRSVAAETGLGVLVLAVTAALVNAVPARESYLPQFSDTVTGRAQTGGSVQVGVLLRPARAGWEGLTVRASDGRARLPLSAATATFTNPGLGIGPITVELTVTAGEVDDALVSVPSTGRWEVRLQLRQGAQTYLASTSYDVR